MDAKKTGGIDISAPEWFERDDFMRWLRQDHVATWCHEGGDYSDAFTVFNNGEGPDSPDNGDRGLPEDIWREICRACGEAGLRNCLVRILPV